MEQQYGQHSHTTRDIYPHYAGAVSNGSRSVARRIAVIFVIHDDMVRL